MDKSLEETTKQWKYLFCSGGKIVIYKNGFFL